MLLHKLPDRATTEVGCGGRWRKRASCRASCQNAQLQPQAVAAATRRVQSRESLVADSPVQQQHAERGITAQGCHSARAARHAGRAQEASQHRIPHSRHSTRTVGCWNDSVTGTLGLQTGLLGLNCHSQEAPRVCALP